MVKHILGQAMFQTVILFVFVFGGQNFIPEGVEGVFNEKDPKIGITNYMVKNHTVEAYRNWDSEYVMSGMVQDFYGQPVYKPYEDHTSSRHLSVVFNLFVLM